jgi:hypothetical protein
MNDNDLKQAIRHAEHPPLSVGFEQRALEKIGCAANTESSAVIGNTLGLIGLSRRSQAVLLALMLLAAGLLVQQQFLSQAEDDLLGIDTLSMSTLLAL